MHVKHRQRWPGMLGQCDSTAGHGPARVLWPALHLPARFPVAKVGGYGQTVEEATREGGEEFQSLFEGHVLCYGCATYAGRDDKVSLLPSNEKRRTGK